MKKRLAPFGLTPVQTLVLEAIKRAEGLSATEIGKKLSLDSATLSGILDRLADRGWIIKQIHQDDKRTLRLHLSEKAKLLENDLIQARAQSNDDILKGFSTEERVLLKRLLKDINR
jgi:DNA-binding MarR family transcriptional regulator